MQSDAPPLSATWWRTIELLNGLEDKIIEEVAAAFTDVRRSLTSEERKEDETALDRNPVQGTSDQRSLGGGGASGSAVPVPVAPPPTESGLHCPECGAASGSPHKRKCRIERMATAPTPSPQSDVAGLCRRCLTLDALCEQRFNEIEELNYRLQEQAEEIERLTERSHQHHLECAKMLGEKASLQQEIERLWDALEMIVDRDTKRGGTNSEDAWELPGAMAKIARAALERQTP